MAADEINTTSKTRRQELTAEHLRELLHYNPETGAFTWRVYRCYRAVAGQRAGFKHETGYEIILVARRQYLAHRLAWLYVRGRWPSADIDHINGVRDDNRLANLREATRQENAQNVGVGSCNRSGYVGVSWNASKRKWVAFIGANSRRKFLGYYQSAETAYAAYLRAKADLHTFQPSPRLS